MAQSKELEELYAGSLIQLSKNPLFKDVSPEAIACAAEYAVNLTALGYKNGQNGLPLLSTGNTGLPKTSTNRLAERILDQLNKDILS